MDAASLEIKATECPVCHEHYKEPKILPCAHLLCRNCLVSWMKTNKNAQCPLCRCAIVDPHNRAAKTCDDVVDQLPTDEVMSEMVENSNTFNQKRVCYVHKGIKAKSFCLHCGFMLCNTCNEVHKTIPATSFHKLKNVEELTLENLTSSRQSLCSTHPHQESKHYCVFHGILICNECAFTKHHVCPGVSSISEVFEKSKRSLSEIVERLNAVESALSQVMAEVEENLIDWEQNTKDSLTKIDAVCDRLVLSIENCRKRLKKIVQDEHDDTMSELYKQKESLGHKRGPITSHRSLINRIQLSASCTSLVSMVPRLLKRVNDLNLNVLLLSDCKPLTTSKLTIDEKALSRIELELARLGQLTAKSFLKKEQAVWRFHPHHGKSIVLQNNGLTAESNMLHSAIVFSSEPMKMNLLYEIRVEETNTMYNGNDVGFGFATKDPAAIPYLPACSNTIQFAIVVFSDGIFIKAKSTPHTFGDVYKTIKVGSRLGVVVDAARCLHIYVDGKDQGVVYRDLQQPCYAMFDLYMYLKKVTVLPLTSRGTASANKPLLGQGTVKPALLPTPKPLSGWEQTNEEEDTKENDDGSTDDDDVFIGERFKQRDYKRNHWFDGNDGTGFWKVM